MAIIGLLCRVWLCTTFLHDITRKNGQNFFYETESTKYLRLRNRLKKQRRSTVEAPSSRHTVRNPKIKHSTVFVDKSQNFHPHWCCTWRMCLFFSSCKSVFEFFSVVDPGCLSRFPDPDLYPSRIRIQQQQWKRYKIFFIPTLFWCHNYNNTRYSKLFFYW